MFIEFYTVKVCINVYLRLAPHPTLFVTHLWIQGMYNSVCVCVHPQVHMRVCVHICTCHYLYSLTIYL
jgi:hypothetical protein